MQSVPLQLSCVLLAFLISCLENPIPYKNHFSSTNSPDIPDLKEMIVVTMGQTLQQNLPGEIVLATVVRLETYCYGKLLQMAPGEAQPQQREVNSLAITGSRFNWNTWVADTGKTAQAVPVPCLFLWLKQPSLQTCSTASILQTKKKPPKNERTKQLNPPHPQQIRNRKKKPKTTSQTKTNRKKKSTANKGIEGNSASCTAWGSQHFAKGKEQAI